MELDRIYRRPTQLGGSPKKKKDEKARKRNVIMNFRVSQQEKELIESRIKLSGLSKASFFIQSCLYQKILVKGNIKSFDEIKKRLDVIEAQVKVSGDLADMEPEIAESLRTIMEIFSRIYERK